MQYIPNTKVFITFQDTVKEVTILNEKIHATAQTPYFIYQDENGDKGKCHPDFLHLTREEAQKEADAYTANIGKENPIETQVLANRIERQKAHCYNRETTERIAKNNLKNESELLEKLIIQGLPNLPKEEALRIFCIVHNAYHTLNDAHHFAFVSGEEAFHILQTKTLGKTRRKTPHAE